MSKTPLSGLKGVLADGLAVVFSVVPVLPCVVHCAVHSFVLHRTEECCVGVCSVLQTTKSWGGLCVPFCVLPGGKLQRRVE